MEISLGIMAAGIGSRFKDGCKQLTPVGPSGEVIMEYSIYDALEAGFNHIVFIIRKNLEEDFRTQLGSKLEGLCKVDYAFQDMNDLPEGFTCPDKRTKPWGTGHAVLAARDVIQGPFAVINADDYYGKEAFIKIHDCLVEQELARQKGQSVENCFCMPGFVLGNTLSDHGTVTRGICQMDKDGYLINIEETHDIEKKPDKAVAGERELDLHSLVSMNMWGLTPEFMKILEDRFVDFLKAVPQGNLTSEYLLPTIIGELLEEGTAKVKVLETGAHWFGLTYSADTPLVRDSLKQMTDAGVYSNPLFKKN
ncbi:MAG: sugar phosphate nucleotidyltransferase [Lachnospiraceae bacterium]|nr:sugar phosphate nucleotidyltransferase [Lachnospiraceae bacterium]